MDGAALARRVNMIGPWLRRRFGARVVRVPLEAGFGCPNRDGTLGVGGCVFCGPLGSGRGQQGKALAQQLAEGIRRARTRGITKVIAYFQSFTSTYCTAEHFARLVEQALGPQEVVALAVGTRPDCIGPGHWDVLVDAARRVEVWVELGLQSAWEPTLRRIGRGHGVGAFTRAVEEAKERGIKVVAHVLGGLPGEGPEHLALTARYLARVGVWGVKLHNLMVLRGSRLEGWWREGRYRPWSLEGYVGAACWALALLPREVVVHRLVAEPGAEQLLAPEWAANKDRVLEAILRWMQSWGINQGMRI